MSFKNTPLVALIGFIIGVTSFYYLGTPREVIRVVETEKMIPVEIYKVEKVEVPTIVEKTVIKEVEVEKKVMQTQVIYLPAKAEVEVNTDEQYCMALNIYREANNQSIAGMIAVARVVMNRVQDRRWPAKV